MSGRERWDTVMAIACTALAAGVTAIVLLGPLVAGAIEYRTSESGLNQLKGADLASLTLVAPAALFAAALWWRCHPLAPIVSLAPGAYAVYLFAQPVLGSDYALYEGNNERFFLLYLATIVIGATIALHSWSALDLATLAEPPPRLRRLVAGVLIAGALFLAFGLHLAGVVDATRGVTPDAYAEHPAAFWTVKLMDLGIVVPVSLAAGVGLLRGSATALRAAYGLSGAYALLGASVTAMAIVMQVNDDPDASPALLVGFAALTVAFAGIAVRLARSAIPGRAEGWR